MGITFLETTQKSDERVDTQNGQICNIMWKCLEHLIFDSSRRRGVEQIGIRIATLHGDKTNTLPIEHGDAIFNICNTPSARTPLLKMVLCKIWCENAPYETYKKKEVSHSRGWKMKKCNKFYYVRE